MKTKNQSSTRIAREKKLNIFRFSIKPTLIKSSILFALLLIFYFIVFPHFVIPVFVVHVDQLALVHTVFVFCRILFLAIIVLTGIRCFWINTKRVRIKKGTIMYRSGIIFNHTKKYFYYGDAGLRYTCTESVFQKIANVCTIKICGLKLGDDKKNKKIVFKNLKRSEDLIIALYEKL